jgi:hypothetical protein
VIGAEAFKHPTTAFLRTHFRRDVHGEICQRAQLIAFGSSFWGIIFRVFLAACAADGRCPSGEEQRMKNMQDSLDKLRADAAKFSMMSVLATDAQNREYFARLADHLNVLASEIARAIAAKVGGSTPSG